MSYYFGMGIVAFGILLIFISAFGCLRMKNSYMVMHAAGVADSCGAPIAIIGLIVMNGFNVVSLKLAMLIVFIVFLSPTATHSLANIKFYQEDNKKQ